MAFAGMNRFSTPQGFGRYVRVQWQSNVQSVMKTVYRVGRYKGVGHVALTPMFLFLW